MTFKNGLPASTTTRWALPWPVGIEQAGSSGVRVAERFSYADTSPEAIARNRCGRLLRYDDSAGSQLIGDYALMGQPLNETRHFLAQLDLPDWPEALPERDELLEPGAGATRPTAACFACAPGALRLAGSQLRL
ncbi:hypothetical protein D9M71_56670 [compost metagenome]